MSPARSLCICKVGRARLLAAIYPIQGVAPPGGDASVCADRVARFIDANANLKRLTNVDGYVQDESGNPSLRISPNRFIWTAAILTINPNPIKNQRLFVWQQYADFVPSGGSVPNEDGLNFWTCNITVCPYPYNTLSPCGTGVNENNPCTDGKRVDVSRAFWLSVYGSWFNTTTYALTNFDQSVPSHCGGSDTYPTANEKFLDEVYCVYLRRRPEHSYAYPTNWDSGFKFWFDALNAGYGNPANQAGVNFIIKAFIESDEYKRRFGPP